MPGKGSVIGDAIVKHPLVKKVSFTGGTTTGRALARLAADKLMPVTLELGGKSPTIVFEDADLDHAVNGVLYGIFSSSGEACIAGSRLFVAASRSAPQFLDRLVAKANALRVGDPEDARTQMGPLITAKHRESIERYVAARPRRGRQAPRRRRAPEGRALRPRLVLPADHPRRASPTARASARKRSSVRCWWRCPFATKTDLVAQANDSVFGLAAGIWTRDYKRAWRTARALEAGTVWINTYKQFSISTPFGGIKESGLGIEKGRLGILQYKHQKSLYWGLNEQPLAWAD